MKSNVIIFLSLLFGVQTFSQEVPVIEKKKYTAPDGKFYVQKSLPIYLFLGTNADDKNGTTILKSERHGAYSNPLYFDSEGLNTIRTPWCVDPKTRELKLPKEEIIFEVYADSKAPVTRLKFNTSKTFSKNGKTYVGGKVEITLSASDQLVGVEKTMFSLNGEAYKDYNAAIILDEEKEYMLKYFSYDFVGNVEEVKSIIIVVDKSSPKTSMELQGEFKENILSGKCAIVLKTEEGSSGMDRLMVKINDGPEYIYSGAIQTTRLPQGEHKLVYYALDNLGNAEEQKEFSFYVDKTAPTLLPEIIGKTFMVNGREFSSGRSQLKLTSIDNKAGVKEIYYSINNSEFALYTKPVFLSSTGGNLKVRAYAVDWVNNKSEVTDEAQSSSVPYIDLSGPSLSHRYSGPEYKSADTVYISPKTKIHLGGNDQEAGMGHISYSIDGINEVEFTTPFSIEQAGLHEIKFTGFDNVENSSNASFKLFVDDKGPEMSVKFSTQNLGKDENNLTIYPSHVGVFISSSDPESGYDRMNYSLNGSKEKAFTGFVTGFNGAKNHLRITAFDKLGNSSTMELEFSVK